MKITKNQCVVEEQNGGRSLTVEISEGVKVNWTSMQNEGKDSLKFVLGAGAELKYFSNILGGDADVHIELLGDGARVNSQVVFFGDKEQKMQIQVRHVHKGRDTHSRMVSKGAVKDKSACEFYGNIQMDSGSEFASADLDEKNLLLSSGAKIFATPALEVSHHRANSRHSASFESVDAEKLFYLMARGIGREDAMRLIVEGFFADALGAIDEGDFREKIFEKISSKI